MHEPLSVRHGDANVVFVLSSDDCVLSFKHVINADDVVCVF